MKCLKNKDSFLTYKQGAGPSFIYLRFPSQNRRRSKLKIVSSYNFQLYTRKTIRKGNVTMTFLVVFGKLAAPTPELLFIFNFSNRKRIVASMTEATSIGLARSCEPSKVGIEAP